MFNIPVKVPVARMNKHTYAGGTIVMVVEPERSVIFSWNEMFTIPFGGAFHKLLERCLRGVYILMSALVPLVFWTYLMFK